MHFAGHCIEFAGALGMMTIASDVTEIVVLDGTVDVFGSSVVITLFSEVVCSVVGEIDSSPVSQDDVILSEVVVADGDDAVELSVVEFVSIVFSDGSIDVEFAWVVSSDGVEIVADVVVASSGGVEILIVDVSFDGSVVAVVSSDVVEFVVFSVAEFVVVASLGGVETLIVDVSSLLDGTLVVVVLLLVTAFSVIVVVASGIEHL